MNTAGLNECVCVGFLDRMNITDSELLEVVLNGSGSLFMVNE
jgi:hypothetical protein